MHRSELGDLVVWSHAACSSNRKPRARVLIAHGLGEHSGRHLGIVHALTEAGCHVTRFDFRGSGESRGARQWVERFEDYVEDLHAVRRQMDALGDEGLPLFLFGHSLGGAIVLHYAAHQGEGVQGLVLSSPALRPGGGVSPFKIRVGKALVRFAPRLRISSALDTTAISRDPAVIAAYNADQLNCAFSTLRQGNEILRAFSEIPSLCARISTPTLILHGDADRLILPGGSSEILAALASRDKGLHIFPGGYHELYHDNDKARFFTDVTQWIEAHCR